MIFADANWLLTLTLPPKTPAGRRQRALADKAMAGVREPLRFSPLVALEVRGVLRRLARRPDPPEWTALRDHPGLLLVPADWPRLLEEADALQRRFCPRSRLGALDALHLAAARLMGARSFYSFDSNSDLRPCALALGFKLQPRPQPEEEQAARQL